MKIKEKIFSKSKKLDNFFIPIVFFLVFILIFLNKTDSLISQKLKTTSADIIVPISYVVSLPINLSSKLINKVNDYRLVSKENIRLNEEIRRLKQWQVLSLKLIDENQAYKKLLNVEDESIQLNYTVKVITKSPKTFMNSIQINAGMNKNIINNSTIINDRGLVGRVINVSNNTSRVLLINDINSSVPVKALNQEIYAIVTGHPSNKLLKLKFVKDNKKMQLGQILVTSGNTGLFPKQIGVGKIIKITTDQVYIRPFVNFDKLDYVQVVTDKKQ